MIAADVVESCFARTSKGIDIFDGAAGSGLSSASQQAANMTRSLLWSYLRHQKRAMHSDTTS